MSKFPGGSDCLGMSMQVKMQYMSKFGKAKDKEEKDMVNVEKARTKRK